MTFIFWALINLIVLFSLCFILFKSLKPKIGSFRAYVSVFIIIGILGVFNSRGREGEVKDGKLRTWELISVDSLDQNFTTTTDIVLEKNWLHSYVLGIQWSNHKSTAIKIPASAFSITNGYNIGTRWVPGFIAVNPSGIQGAYQYEVKGTIKWSILGITFYSQPKHWSGMAYLK